MNKDDILNMPAGREMDALVAEKVMGFGVAWSSYPPPIVTGGTAETIKTWLTLPNYSTNITAAWVVIERMRAIDEHWCPNVCWDDNDGLRPGEWSCGMCYFGEVGEFREEVANASTPMLAICRAALLAVSND
jgi:hypothetical protein